MAEFAPTLAAPCSKGLKDKHFGLAQIVWPVN
jgi:hypothetical protein